MRLGFLFSLLFSFFECYFSGYFFCIRVGIYVGAGSLEETGYIYAGDVTEADLKARTA